VLAVVLFVGVFALRVAHPNVSDADEILYVLPVAALAIRFGLRGGLPGACWGWRSSWRGISTTSTES